MKKFFSFLLLVMGCAVFYTQTLQARHGHYAGYRRHSWWRRGYSQYSDPFWWTYYSMLNATRYPRQKVIVIKEEPKDDYTHRDYEYIEEILRD